VVGGKHVDLVPVLIEELLLPLVVPAIMWIIVHLIHLATADVDDLTVSHPTVGGVVARVP
jgi:hypothetical protein